MRAQTLIIEPTLPTFGYHPITSHLPPGGFGPRASAFSIVWMQPGCSPCGPHPLCPPFCATTAC
jgi:hypothetical protein